MRKRAAGHSGRTVQQRPSRLSRTHARQEPVNGVRARGRHGGRPARQLAAHRSAEQRTRAHR